MLAGSCRMVGGSLGFLFGSTRTMASDGMSGLGEGSAWLANSLLDRKSWSPTPGGTSQVEKRSNTGAAFPEDGGGLVMGALIGEGEVVVEVEEDVVVGGSVEVVVEEVVGGVVTEVVTVVEGVLVVVGRSVEDSVTKITVA